MLQLDRKEDGTYILSEGQQVRQIPTFTALMKVLLDRFQEGERAAAVGRQLTFQQAHGMSTMADLIYELHTYNLTPHQIISILGKLESSISSNIPYSMGRLQPRQLQLSDMGFVTEGAKITVTEAEPFECSKALCERMGNLYEYKFNGRTAVSEKGHRDTPIFIKTQIIPQLKTLGTRAREESLMGLNIDKQILLIKYIETLKDMDMGIYPMTHVITRIEQDAGEIDSKLFEAGGGTSGDLEEIGDES